MVCCGAQHYSRDVLSFIFLVLTAVNLWKALRAYNKGPDLLNRQQTDEWKGWMQVGGLNANSHLCLHPALSCPGFAVLSAVANAKLVIICQPTGYPWKSWSIDRSIDSDPL